MQEVVEGLLREVVKDGRSVFFSSHDLAEVEQVCHRVAMLRGGCVIDVFDLAERRRSAAQRITVTFAGSPPRPAQEPNLGPRHGAGRPQDGHR